MWDKFTNWIANNKTKFQGIIFLIVTVMSIVFGLVDATRSVIFALLIFLAAEVFFIVVAYLETIHKHITTLNKSNISMIPRNESYSDLLLMGKNYTRMKISAATSYNLLKPGQGHGREIFLEFLNSGIIVEFILANPNEPVTDDFFMHKVFWTKDDNEDSEYDFSYKKNELQKSVEWLEEILPNRGHLIKAVQTDMGLYYAMMIMYKNKTKNSPHDFIKIDLYSNHVRDKNRRVLQFERIDANAHFQFFEQEFDYIFKNGTKLPL